MNEMTDIEQMKPGDILWFILWAETDVRGADERDFHEGLLFSGTIKSIELTSFEKMWAPHPDRKQYSVVFEEQLPNPDGSPIYGMTFYVGDREHMNHRCYLNREDAEATVREHLTNRLEEAHEALAEAQKAVAFCEQHATQPAKEISWEATLSGFRLSTVLEAQAEIDARTK